MNEHDLPSHVELLVLGRQLLFVAIVGDVDEFEAVVTRLRAELDRHIDSEEVQFGELPPRAATAAHRGQAALASLLDHLLADLAERDLMSRPGDWLDRAIEVQLALRHQAVVESLVLRRRRRRQQHLGRQG